MRLPFPVQQVSVWSPRLLGALLVLAMTAPLAAQEAVPATNSHAPALTVNARLVVLDVVVTDKSGKPVDGLAQEDFQIFEDGQMQRIRSLEAPAAHSLPAETVEKGVAAVFDPAKPVSFGLSPVTVLVLDQLNTHFADSSFARRAVKEYLDKEPELLAQPATLVTVYDNQIKQLQGFTRDRGALLRALAAAPTRYGWTLEIHGKTEHGPIERLDQSLRALEQMAQSYARIPGRKNMVWVGGGFPSLDPAAINGDDGREVKDALQHVTDVLLDTRITMYAIDPSSSAAGMTEITDATQMAFVQATGDALAGGMDPFGATDDFDALGPVTGGRLIRARNDVAELIAGSVELGAKSYTLTYSPSMGMESGAKDGSAKDSSAQYRKIKVVCLRPGLSVATRTGYFAGQTVEDRTAASAAYDLSAAAEGTMPLNGLRVVVEAVAGAAANSYVVRVGADGLTWKPKDDGSAGASVYVLAVSLNAKNKMVGHTLQGMSAGAGAGVDVHDPARLADFEVTAAPAPKSAVLRFVVRDSATGRMGSADVALKKP